MQTFKQFLLEKAPPTAPKFLDLLLPVLKSELDIEPMDNKRGAEYDKTKMYQQRIKSTVDTPRAELVKQVEKVLQSPAAEKFGISNVKVNARSVHSGKFSSVSFDANDITYDLVISQGANEGEKFETELLNAMKDYVKGEYNELAESAFSALEDVDEDLAADNIKEVKARTGSTKRSGNTAPAEVGKIIADIIIVTDDGDEHYISVKNQTGQTVGQFGMSAAFKKNLTVDTATEEWKRYGIPFELDAKRIERGLRAYSDKQDIGSNTDTDTVKIPKSSKIYDVMQSLWGTGYIYLRQKGDTFKAFRVDEEFVNDKLLKNLRVTEVRYPNSTRKQITIFLSSDSTKYKLEMRNPRGRDDIAPTQAQLIVVSSTSELNK